MLETKSYNLFHRTVDRKEKNHFKNSLEVDDLKWVMGDKKGRRFIGTLLERAGIFRLSFNTNVLLMSFNEGTRNEGLRLVSLMMDHCFSDYIKMLEEIKE